jgi:hypothetical protein
MQQHLALSGGVIITVYTYQPSDFITHTNKSEGEEEELHEPLSSSTAAEVPRQGNYVFYAVCWKGNSPSINVMCGKVELDSMKHALKVLNVYR